MVDGSRAALHAPGCGQQLDVATAAVQVLLMLHGVLEDEVLALVVEWLGQLGVEREELGVGASLDASVVSLASGPLASGLGELAGGAVGLLPCGSVPARLPIACNAKARLAVRTL